MVSPWRLDQWKTAPLFCGSVRQTLFSVQTQLVRLHTKPTHTHSLPLCRLCAVVETLWTLTSSLRDHWGTLQTESGNIVPGNDITLRLLSLLYHRDGSRDCRMHQSRAHPTPTHRPPKDQRTQTKCRNAASKVLTASCFMIKPSRNESSLLL